MFSVDGLQEIVEILSAKKCIRQRLLSSLYFYIQSQDFYKQFSKVGVTDASENPIIYAYWANYKLLSFTHSLKWKTIVTRMHGYDLYNEDILLEDSHSRIRWINQYLRLYLYLKQV